MNFRSFHANRGQFKIKSLVSISLRILILILFINQTIRVAAESKPNEKEIENINDKKNPDRSSEASSIISRDKHGATIDSIHDSLPESSSASTYQVDPMNTAASHHHKKGAKGWLDMGAWTKKKGAFGWYADFPVGGKGK